MSHDSDIRGAEPMINKARLALKESFSKNRGHEVGDKLDSEEARNVLVQFVIGTRRNYELQLATRKLAQAIGVSEIGADARRILIELQAQAREPVKAMPPPLPAGVRGPLGDDDPTPALGNEVVHVHEIDVRDPRRFRG